MIRAVILGFAAVIAAPLAAQGGDWPEITSGNDVTTADVERMARDFPHGGSLQLRLLGPALEAGDHAAVRAALWRFVGMGGVLSDRGMEAVSPAFPDGELTLLRARMAANSAPIARSQQVGQVRSGLGLIEGVVHVPFGDNVLVSSVTERMIFAFADRRWSPYVSGPMRRPTTSVEAGSLMGMAFDQRRGWLWAASAVVDQTPDPSTAFSGLIGIAPGRNEVLWLPVAEGDQPGDVALGPDGAVFVSDSVNGSIYVRSIGDVELERLVDPGRLRSPQGMVVSPDGTGLIVADYNYGLARVDFETGRVDQLAYDGPDMLDGIDGLLRHGDALIAIRNGVAPHAILRIEIDAAGRQVLGVETLERANPEWGEPTLGTIDGDTLYYIADARWADFGEGGVLNEGAEPRPTAIRALPLPRRDD